MRLLQPRNTVRESGARPNRLGRPLVTPDLEPLGYRLMGGRLLAGAAGDPTAQLMYEDAAGARLNV